MEPGPWTFGELLAVAEGRRSAMAEQAGLVWGGGKTGSEKRVQMVGPEEAGRLLNMAFRSK